MHDSNSTSSSTPRYRHRREPPPPPPPSTHRRRSWCCSFSVPPHSPESYYEDGGKNRYCVSSTPSQSSKHFRNPPTPKKTEMLPKSPRNSFPNSPQSQGSTTSSSSKLGLRRILSPGRVSPIDEPAPVPTPPSNGRTAASSLYDMRQSPLRDDYCTGGGPEVNEDGSLGNFDVRLNLKARNGGGSLILELSSAVLAANSLVFAGLIADYRKDTNANGLCRIEVPDVENLAIFRETIELMFDEDIPKKLLTVGAFRAIDILEVAAGIKFVRGVSSCLKFLEAVPWSEEEEEKLRLLFTKYKFDDGISRDILARLYALESVEPQQTLAKQLLWSITTCADTSAGNELKSLVKGLLSKSSVYEKDHNNIERDDILAVCQSCLTSLVSLFEEASGTARSGKLVKKDKDKPMIERISKQVDNLIWLLYILIDHQMAEEMVDMWADQRELVRLHETSSSMIRYELSRVSAMLFIALGTRKLHCRSDSRVSLFSAWFRPMLLDFGWLQRCKKGLDVKALEEAMGQALLTLPLKEQYTLFMDWFCHFSKSGTECPNLSKAFQIWWRRSFLRGSETSAIESR